MRAVRARKSVSTGEVGGIYGQAGYFRRGNEGRRRFTTMSKISRPCPSIFLTISDEKMPTVSGLWSGTVTKNRTWSLISGAGGTAHCRDRAGVVRALRSPTASPQCRFENRAGFPQMQIDRAPDRREERVKRGSIRMCVEGEGASSSPSFIETVRSAGGANGADG